MKHQFLLALAALTLTGSPVFAQNLITNADFSLGNTGFTSAYTYAPAANTTEAQYTVRTNPNPWLAAFASFGDRTSGTGNMMVVNGASTAGVSVWGQSGLSVAPNTTYYFSAWVTSVFARNPAILQFRVNGAPVDAGFRATAGTPDWRQFYSIWNSGASTTANISLVNLNTVAQGNDFALDDLAFSRTPPAVATAAPEPGSLALLGLALPLALALSRTKIVRLWFLGRKIVRLWFPGRKIVRLWGASRRLASLENLA